MPVFVRVATSKFRSRRRSRDLAVFHYRPKAKKPGEGGGDRFIDM